MPKHQYAWLLTVAIIAAHQAKKTIDIDAEDSGPAWAEITAKAGRLQDLSARSANDATIAAALFILLLIYAWNCAKYRAQMAVYNQSRAKYFQINGEPIFSPEPAQTRTSSGLLNWPANFSSPSAVCQMNRPLT